MTLTLTDYSALAWTTTTIAAAVVFARLYVRISIRAVGTDDYWMLAALIWAICAAALAQSDYSSHARPNAAGFYPNDYRTKQAMSSQSTYFSTLCSRTSVGILLLRILGATMRWQRVFIVVLIAGVWFTTFLVLLQGFFPKCSAALSNVAIVGCLDAPVGNGFFQLWSFFGVAVDFAFSTLPGFIITKLNLASSRKSALCLLLGLGWLASIFTLLKTVAPLAAWNAITRNTIVPIATYLEQALLMICGSLVTLTPLWRYLRYSEPMDSRQHLAHPDQSRSRDQSHHSSKKGMTLASRSLSTVAGGRESHEPSQPHIGKGIRVDRSFDVSEEHEKHSLV